jgi:hypothetical protein
VAVAIADELNWHDTLDPRVARYVILQWQQSLCKLIPLLLCDDEFRSELEHEPLSATMDRHVPAVTLLFILTTCVRETGVHYETEWPSRSAFARWLSQLGQRQEQRLWLITIKSLGGLHLGDQDMSNLNLAGSDFGRGTLRGALLSESCLRGANLTECDLESGDLSGADLRDAKMQGCNLSHATLAEANLRDACLQEANLTDAILDGADLRSADLSDACLNRASLRNANLESAIIDEASLSRADMRGANVRGVRWVSSRRGSARMLLCQT